MLATQALRVRRDRERRTTRLATVPPLILAALFLAGHSGGTARAQGEAPAGPGISPIGDARECRLSDGGVRDGLKYKRDGKEEIDVGSFLLEANRSGFVRIFRSALEDYHDYLCDKADDPDDRRSRYYRVIRVTAAPGYGKSALFRYLEEIMKPGSNINGTYFDSVLDRLRQNVAKKELMYMINLDKLGGTFALRTTLLDDLRNDAGAAMPAFARVRAFDYDDHQAPSLDALIGAFLGSDSGLDCPILIIDGIDEIHPDSARSLLERIDDDIAERKKTRKKAGAKADKPPFRRVFVVGRSEGFSDYYRIPQGGTPKGPPIELQLPRYETKRDLRKAIELEIKFNLLEGGQAENVFDLQLLPLLPPALGANSAPPRNLILVAKEGGGQATVLRFKIFNGDGEEAELEVRRDALSLRLPGKDNRPITLTEQSASIGDPFDDLDDRLKPLWNRLTISDAEKAPVPDAEKAPVIEKVVSLATTIKVVAFMNDPHFEFLRECPYNLSAFGELVRASDRYSPALKGDDVKELFFQFLLARNRESHHRPISHSSEYIELLEEVAYKYANITDKHGYFLVTPGDSVSIDVMPEGAREPRTSTYLVEAVLNRSGVAHMSPANLYIPRYRFYPGWVHDHLVSRYRKRPRQKRAVEIKIQFRTPGRG